MHVHAHVHVHVHLHVHVQFVGVDIGSCKAVVGVADCPFAGSAKLVRNNLGNDNTPVVVATTGSQLLLGELAVDQVRTNPKNAVSASAPRSCHARCVVC